MVESGGLDTGSGYSPLIGCRDSATDKTVELRVVGDQDEEEVRVCCEVKVLSDSGYGHMQALKKEKCADFKIVNGSFESSKVAVAVDSN